MTDREVMKMAFDAFEDLKKSVTRDGTVSENWDAYYEKEYYALEALRQALTQPEQEELIQFKDGKWSYVRKPWQGLTDEESKGILDCGRGGLVDIKKAEQILKEKNSAL